MISFVLARRVVLGLRGQTQMSFQKTDYKTCSQLFLACHRHECSCNLTLTLQAPDDSLISSPGTWHLMAQGCFIFLIKYWNSILDITHWPLFIAPSRWLWTLQSLHSPGGWILIDSRIMTRIVRQLSADLDTSNEVLTILVMEMVTDSQIDRGEVTADSSLPSFHQASNIQTRHSLTWSGHGSVACLWSACVSMWRHVISLSVCRNTRHFLLLSVRWTLPESPWHVTMWLWETWESHRDLRHSHNFRLSPVSGVQVERLWRRIMIIGWNLRSQSRNIIICRPGY